MGGIPEHLSMEEIRTVNGIHELTSDLSGSPHWNRDISPTTIAGRKWGKWDIAALIIGILPNIPGFLSRIGVGGIPEFWQRLYTYAWFVGFAVSFFVYWSLMKRLATKIPGHRG